MENFVDNFRSWISRLPNILNYSVGENTLMEIILAFAMFLALFLAFRIFQRSAVKHMKRAAQKTKTDLDDEVVRLVEGIPPFFYLVLAIYFPLKNLVIPDPFTTVIDGAFALVLIWQVIKIISGVINFSLQKHAQKNGQTEAAESAYYGLKVLIEIALWVIGGTFFLSNIGVNVTSLIATLGIGSIAIALAMQNILGDIFSSFSIYFDKPFKVGDFIVIGDDSGIVQKIGLKTTRLATLQGEELVVPNRELTSVRVQNFKKMKKRRVVFQIAVEYGTDLNKLKRVSEIIKEAVSKEKLAEIDRVNFFEFGEKGLNFEVVFFLDSPDYNEYMQVRENINLAIKKAFDEEGIEFAVYRMLRAEG